MFMAAISIIIYAFLVFFELTPLYRNKAWKDFWVTSVISLLSLVVAVLLSLGVEIPSPADPIKNMVISTFGKG